MRLKNYTDIPSEKIRDLIRAVRPAGISNFDVRVSNGRRFRGRAYHAGSGYHDRADPFIVCCIPAKEHLVLPARGAYLPMAMGSRVEQLIVLLAHELRHLWQATHSRGKVHGARGRFSEKDADAYALRMLRKYRRGELCPTPNTGTDK
jgi:hypothetical protein